MRIEIDVNRSIQKGRLMIVKRNWSNYFDNIIYVCASSFLCLTGVTFSYYLLNRIITDGSWPGFLLSIIGITFMLLGFLTLYSLVNDNKLVRMSSAGLTGDNEHLAKLLDDKLNIRLEGGRTLFRSYSKPKFFKWARRVIVIRDDQDILINISRFNEKKLKSPFHLFFDVLLIKSLDKQAKKAARKAG